MQLPECGDIFDGRYELQRLLGSGGMGTVYLALDRSMHRLVAVKIMRPQGGGYSADTESRFTREAQIIAKLRDPHTVTMFDFGRSADDLLYMVFEHVPGQDLSELIRAAGRLEPPTTVHILVQVLESLREAHRAGLLHRDVKPENIRVFEDEANRLSVKLLDFGIARHADPNRPSITRAGELLGTPRYMSPEQLTEGVLTPASDIYSLGVVAFEMLMGSDALQGSRWTDQLDRLASGHVFSIPEVSRWGADLVTIVGKMSARNPSQRYQSADAVLTALRPLNPATASLPTLVPRADEGRSPKRVTTRQRVTQSLREIPTPVVVVVAVLLTLGVGIPLAKIVEQQDEARVLIASPRASPGELIRPTAAATANQLRSETSQDTADAGLPTKSDAGQPIDGCGRPAPFIGTGELEATVGLTHRRWVAHVPKDYDPDQRHPLVMLFHQDAQRPLGILEETRLSELADVEGFIIVAPYGGPGISWDGRESVRRALSDFEFTREQLCVDDERVFALGHGPGGRAAVRFRCVLPQLAALATTSYRLEVGIPVCDGFTPIPTLLLAPTADGNAPLEGGSGCSIVPKLGLEQHKNEFKRINSCQGPQRVESEHGTSTCYEWSCEQPFVACELDGGRGWPGARERRLSKLGGMLQDIRGSGDQNKSCDGAPADFPFATKIWEFFENAAP